MSNHSDTKHSGASHDALKVTAAAKREHQEPVEGNGSLPSSLALVFVAVICFAGVYFGIYHGGFDGDVFNESDSTPALFSSKKSGASVSDQPVAELSLVELSLQHIAN